MPKTTIVPENARRSSEMLSREQRLAIDAADRETAAVENHPDVITARQAAEEAEQQLTTLEQRVVDGDEKVTATHTGKAREEARFAQLRLSAARKAVRDQRDQDRQQAHDDALQQVRTALTDTHGPAALDELKGQAIEALTAYLTAVSGHNDALRQAVSTLRQAGLTKYDSEWEADKAGASHALVSFNSVRLDGQTHEPLQPETLTDYVVFKAARASGTKGPGGRDLRAKAYSGHIPTGWTA
ncbi:hypothetical protein BGM19_06990 [Streptomyces agglomeratus]|uniref:hypothetical protein n=1 Tax=Streptomyces agglomeratus TaxID=285458 RepID=UPI00086D8C0D|nr:hypothetical protein [Streptomyces agglomeratus]OEJ57750.1 hypothetical protein BGM19_06990 [Streptomyces agglomeratus]